MIFYNYQLPASSYERLTFVQLLKLRLIVQRQLLYDIDEASLAHGERLTILLTQLIDNRRKGIK